jgi:glycosyltransferase involved in cell wall biosynthesis
MSSAPEISICIATYNGAMFLEECLVSIASQTEVSVEVILLDDDSTDDTLQIARAVSLSYPSVDWVIRKNSVRLGMAANWNACVSQARGEFIKLVGQDDVLLPNCLKRQANALREHSNVSVAATKRTIINRESQRLFEMPTRYPRGITLGSTAALQCLLSGTNIIGDPVAVLFRRNALTFSGLFNPDIKYCTDMEMWLRLLACGDLYFDTTPLVLYRIHQNATGQTVKNIVATDFLRALVCAEKLFSWRISPMQRFCIKHKAQLLTILRNSVYALFTK